MTSTTFGDRLRQARHRRKLTLQHLARAVGIHYTSLIRYEQGSREPEVCMLAKLCGVLGTSADWLIGRDRVKRGRPADPSGS